MSRNRKRGSILVYAFLMIITMGVMAVAMASVHQRTLMQQSREMMYVSRKVDVSSATHALQVAALTAFVNGDLSATSSNVAEIMTAQASSFPDFSMSATAANGGIPFSRSSGFGPIPPDRTNDAFERSSHILQYDFTSLITFSGEKAGLQSGTVGAYQRVASCKILEIPTANFQLVTYEEAFSGSASTDIQIDGVCLFVEGLDGSDDMGSFSTRDYSISMGATPGALSQHRLGQVQKGSVLTWGLSDMADLFATTGTGNVLKQSFLLEDAAGTIDVNWTDPLIAPTTLPMGVTHETFDGAPRLVLDLALMAESNHYYFNCTGTAENNGIVVKGDESGMLASISIVTNGKVSLYGDNLRVALIGSNYQGDHALYSENFLEGSTDLPATDSTFNGYLFFEQSDLTLSLNEDWASSDLEIVGSIVFRGGSFSGPPTVTITQDLDFVNFMANGSVRSDRFAYVAF